MRTTTRLNRLMLLAWTLGLSTCLYCGTAWSVQSVQTNASCAGVTDPESKVCANSAVSLVDLVLSRSPDSCRRRSDKVIDCTNRVDIANVSDLGVLGGGWTLRFSNPQPGKGGIVFHGARNLSLSDFVIEWSEEDAAKEGAVMTGRVFSVGRAVPCGKDSAKVVLDRPQVGSVQIEAISVWDRRRGWPWADQGETLAVERYFLGERKRSAVDGETECSMEYSFLSGLDVIVRHHAYSNNALSCRDCANVLVKNVEAHGVPGMAFMFWGGRDIALIGNQVRAHCAPACESAYPSVSSDASHFGAVGGRIVVVGNDFSMQGDDSVNVTSWVYPSVIAGGGKEAGRVSLRVDARMKARFWALRPGQQVSLADLGMNPLGSGTVQQVSSESMEVVVETAVSAFPATVVLIPLDRIPDEVLIRDNYFHDHRARGVLVQAGNVTIENNRIERVTMAAIMIGADTDYWFEGPGARSVTVRGNAIRQVNARPYGKDYRSAVSAAFVTSREYRGPVGKPIGPVSIEGNRITEVFRNPGQPIHFGAGLCCNRNSASQ